jgi:hypothetical protein
MNTLEDLIDDVLAVIFDDRGPATSASIAAAEVAARLMSRGTTRADLVQSIARLILSVNAELREREAARREAEAMAQLAPLARGPEPKGMPPRPVRVGRQWRVNLAVDALVPRGEHSLTATLMGDPAPGRSALDQRQGGIQ